MVVCSRCGYNNPDDSNYCNRCGVRVKRLGTERWAAPEQTNVSRSRKEEIEYYKRIIYSIWENQEDREASVDRLARFGAHRELMEIARNIWLNDSIRSRARDALKSM